MKVLLICSCFNMTKKASEAFSIFFPNEVLPDIIKGRDRIHKFADKIKNDHITAISKLSGKFAYFVEIEDGKVIQEWNLLKGSRIA